MSSYPNAAFDSEADHLHWRIARRLLVLHDHQGEIDERREARLWENIEADRQRLKELEATP